MSTLELNGQSDTILKIIEDFKSTKGYCSQDLTKLNLCPANVVTILENLNWTLNSFDTNDWQQDTRTTYYHVGYSFGIVVAYSGYYGDIHICREEVE